MSDILTVLDTKVTLQLRAPKLKFYHETKVSMKEFISVPPSSLTLNDRFTPPSDAEFLYNLLERVSEAFLDNEDVTEFKCHAGLNHAIQDFLDSYELLYAKAEGLDTSGLSSKFSGDRRTLYALFRHKENGKSSYYRKNYFDTILSDIHNYAGSPRSNMCCRDGHLRLIFDIEKLFFGSNLVNCFKDGDFELTPEQVDSAFQHGRSSEVPLPFQDLSISGDSSKVVSHISVDMEEPSPSATTNHFRDPVVQMIDIDDDDDDANQHGGSSNSQRRSKKKDSLPGTQFKKYSLLSTLKPLPGCKSHESVHYKSTHKCSRESFDDLDTYGVDDMHVRWSILAKIGTTKIEPSHKRNAVAVTQKVHRVLFSMYNYVRIAASRGIYVPYPHQLSSNCVMGSEYVSCALPDSIYNKYFAMDTALLEDLRHIFKLNPAIANLLLQHTSGYQAYHAILINCCQVYRPAPPRSELCSFDCEKMSISTYALNIQEYILECVVAKENNLSLYRQFLRFIEGFPASARACLLRHAELLFLRDPRFDKDNNIPLQLHPDQWSLFASTNLRRDGISLRSKSLPSKQLNISAVQKNKKVFKCRACGSEDHLWASCPHVTITVKDPTAKKRLLESIPSGNIRCLSSGEDDQVPNDDDVASVASKTDSAGDDNLGVEGDFHDDCLDEGIIASVEHGYFDGEDIATSNVSFDDAYDGTIGSEFLDIKDTFVTKSVPFDDVISSIDVELGEEAPCIGLGEDATTSVPICQHCRSVDHTIGHCPLLSIDHNNIKSSSVDAENIASMNNTLNSYLVGQILPSSANDMPSGFDVTLPESIVVTTDDTFATLADDSILQIICLMKLASKYPSSDHISFLITSTGSSIASFRDSSLTLMDALHPCTPFALLNAVYSSSILRSFYRPTVGKFDDYDSLVIALRLTKIEGAASRE